VLIEILNGSIQGKYEIRRKGVALMLIEIGKKMDVTIGQILGFGFPDKQDDFELKSEEPKTGLCISFIHLVDGEIIVTQPMTIISR